VNDDELGQSMLPLQRNIITLQTDSRRQNWGNKTHASIASTPIFSIERLKSGENVDILIDYEDLNLDMMHVRRGTDCSHYCMMGVPDVVAARLMKEII
jgi:hypothetical protein